MSAKKIDVLKQKLDLYLSNPNLLKKQNKWTDEQFNTEITLLEHQIEQSKRGKRSRNKGNTYERKVAKVFKDKMAVTLARTPQSGGFNKQKSNARFLKGDLSCVDDGVEFRLHIECKDQKTLKMRDWFNQSQEECPAGRVPVLITHWGQVIKQGKRQEEAIDMITLTLDDFLSLIDRSKVVTSKTLTRKKVIRK